MYVIRLAQELIEYEETDTGAREPREPGSQGHKRKHTPMHTHLNTGHISGKYQENTRKIAGTYREHVREKSGKYREPIEKTSGKYQGIA